MDHGLFGPASVTWKVHGDPAMLVGGLRALLIQALNPLAMAGVDQHSDYRVDPWGRLQRTSDYVLTTTFGDTPTALAAGAQVRAVHRFVTGTDSHTGRTYRADDPELLAWVHNVEAHSFLTAYRRYGGRLSGEDADRYVAEMVAAAELVGLRPADVPHDLTALRAALREAALDMSPAARESMRIVLTPPMPLVTRPLWLVPSGAAVALLPRRVRAAYGLPWFPPADAAVRPAVYALFRALNLAFPGSPQQREARRRLAA
jgi:uncharacterized protein (DUF2236 family)